MLYALLQALFAISVSQQSAVRRPLLYTYLGLATVEARRGNCSLLLLVLHVLRQCFRKVHLSS